MNVNFDTVKSESLHKWPSIFDHFGVDVGTGKHKSCPICGGKDRFRFDNKEGRGTWFCNNCGSGDGFKLLQVFMGRDFKGVCEQLAPVVGGLEPSTNTERPINPEALRNLFSRSSPVMKGDLVHKYLKGRGLNSMPRTLRYTSRCWESETNNEQHAMLAVFHAPDGEALTIHRTYLNEYGNKLSVENPKKIMPPRKKMTGGACRLYVFQKGKLCVTEGIETAIACKELMGDVPVWATLSSTLLEGFEPPDECDELIICADNDLNYAGQKAGYTLANRAVVKHKITAHVHVPYKPGTDYLDELMEAKNEGC